MGLAIAASKTGCGLEFAQAVGRSIWGGAANWCEDDILSATLEAAGLALKPFSRWAASSAVTIREDNRRERSRTACPSLGRTADGA